MIKGIIFDFDGVIANSYNAHFKAYNGIFNDLEMDHEFFSNNFGRGAKAVIGSFLKSKGICCSEEEITRFKENKDSMVNIKYAVLNPGVREFLERSKKCFKLAIGSGGRREHIQTFLDHNNIKHYFEQVITAQDVERQKPSPDIFLKVCQLLSLKPKECLVIEDSPVGMKAARSAGTNIVGVETGPYKAAEMPDADLKISDLTQVSKIDEFIRELNTVRLKSYAKLNLALDVIGKRTDGYHDIETIFQTIDLADDIEVTASRDSLISLKCNIKKLENNENICVKAANLLKKEYEIPYGANIILNKKIPIGGGLSGGSSNAAAIIKALNYLWDLGMTVEEMISIALKIGSDVPFHIIGCSCFASGRGELLEMIKLPDIKATVIYPGFESSTAEAFAGIDKIHIGKKMASRQIKSSKTSASKLVEMLHNDFEESILTKYPILSEIKHKVDGHLTGSGSCIFSLKDPSKKNQIDQNQYDCTDKHRYEKYKVRSFNREIILSDEMGFCLGVRRAVEEVRRLSKTKKVYVLGDLIHNTQVIDKLKSEGIEIINSIDEAKGVIAITAHGMPDRVIEDITEKGHDVTDLTCPLVKHVHDITKEAESQGREVVVFGNKNHVEVKGIVGNLTNFQIIKNLDEFKPSRRPITLVSQTTRDYDTYEELSRQMRKIVKDFEFYNTICTASMKRQSAAAEVAKKSDIMIVIGGKKSSNTKRLAEIASNFCETHHIEIEKDLKSDWLLGKEKIGLTAGASSPEWIIQAVTDKIRMLI
ncbi:4-hydroxy-3-methylbut-2-enyl diphosphate reductase [Candidatus Woesearchaeota archaeon]|nr:4-hydroxy-3-methylbut-2-enyl diphosphate reductase [Candidatus Woesearchaeota archaeon]